MRIRGLVISFIFVGVAGLAGIVWIGVHPFQAIPKATPHSKSTPPQRDTTTFDASIASILKQYSYLDISVSVADLTTNHTYHYGESANFEAASVGKLLTASLFLHRLEQRSASLNDPIGYTTAREALKSMIIVSDNAAWQDLNAFLTHDGLNAYAGSIGIHSYDANRNTVDSDDITLLLTKLYSGQLLHTGNKLFLLNLMNQANEKNFIVAAAPIGVTVYHKVGFLDDRLHEAAIVTQNGQAYALTIFSKTYGSVAYNDSVGETLFSAITQAASQAFLH